MAKTEEKTMTFTITALPPVVGEGPEQFSFKTPDGTSTIAINGASRADCLAQYEALFSTHKTQEVADNG